MSKLRQFSDDELEVSELRQLSDDELEVSENEFFAEMATSNDHFEERFEMLRGRTNTDVFFRKLKVALVL